MKEGNGSNNSSRLVSSLFVSDEVIASVFSSGNEFCAKVFDLPVLIHCIVSPLLSLFPTPVDSQM
jgi:hypothetical protein